MSPSITVRWPLNEKATVAWGGDTVEFNAPHAIWASERWAYDLFIEPADTGSKNLEDYGIYNKDVVAAISGTVVASYDEENDILPNTEEFISLEGNHVYIQIDETGTFLLLNHLKKGSVLVKVGEPFFNRNFIIIFRKLHFFIKEFLSKELPNLKHVLTTSVGYNTINTDRSCL